MTLREIEKITKIVSDIKELDNEIIFIEKTARILSENIYDVDFSLSFMPIEIHKKVEVLDSDGFLKKEDTSANKGATGWIINSLFSCAIIESSPTSKGHSISYKIDESLSLKLLAVILRDKQSKRDNLIVQLKLIGIHI